MILLDSLHINSSGGKVLLDYLVSELEVRNIDTFYLFDKRCMVDYNNIQPEKKIYLEASLCKRFRFYQKHKNNFSKVFCFGNIPPPIKLNCPVYTYMHQPMFINIPKEFSLIQRILFKIKSIILNILKTNTDFWLVQGNIIKNGFSEKYSIEEIKIKILPFYPDSDLIDLKNRRKLNSFFYVSNGEPHKNHFRLIEAFCSVYDKLKLGSLIVTVDSLEYPKIANLVESKRNEGYPISNLGFISRPELINKYNEFEYLFFPSLKESYGLGIIESISCGCKVIAPDLPYVKQICEPAIKFNPFKIDSIEEAFKKAFLKEEKSTKELTKNNIEEILQLLTE